MPFFCVGGVLLFFNLKLLSMKICPNETASSFFRFTAQFNDIVT